MMNKITVVFSTFKNIVRTYIIIVDFGDKAVENLVEHFGPVVEKSSANVQKDKILPEWIGLKIALYSGYVCYGISKQFIVYIISLANLLVSDLSQNFTVNVLRKCETKLSVNF